MSLVREESVDKNVGIISMQDFLHFLKVNHLERYPTKILSGNGSKKNFTSLEKFVDKFACERLA